jgi:hypothetical protein
MQLMPFDLCVFQNKRLTQNVERREGEVQTPLPPALLANAHARRTMPDSARAGTFSNLVIVLGNVCVELFSAQSM